MALIRGTAFFTDRGQSIGATETHYLMAADLTQAKKDFHDLMVARTKLLARKCEHDKSRVSDDSVWRDSLIEDGLAWTDPTGESYSKLIEDKGDPDFEWTNLLIAETSGTLYRRPASLAFLPDSLTLSSQGRIIDTDWIKLFNAYTKVLTNGKYAIKCFSRDPAVAPEKDVINYSYTAAVGATPAIAAVTAKAHGFAQGDKIAIRATKLDKDKLNGHWTVEEVVTADLFKLKGPKLPTGQLLKDGKCRKLVPSLQPIDNVIQRHIHSRKRGTNFLTVRGRAR